MKQRIDASLPMRPEWKPYVEEFGVCKTALVYGPFHDLLWCLETSLAIRLSEILDPRTRCAYLEDGYKIELEVIEGGIRLRAFRDQDGIIATIRESGDEWYTYVSGPDNPVILRPSNFTLKLREILQKDTVIDKVEPTVAPGIRDCTYRWTPFRNIQLPAFALSEFRLPSFNFSNHPPANDKPMHPALIALCVVCAIPVIYLMIKTSEPSSYPIYPHGPFQPTWHYFPNQYNF